MNASPIPSETPNDSHFAISWRDLPKPLIQMPIDPSYPDGCEISVAMENDRSCRVAIPYPASGCGVWSVVCLRCGITVALTAAGRRDDPHSLTVPCRQPDKAPMAAAG